MMVASVRKASSADICGVCGLYGAVHAAEEAGVTLSNWKRDVYPTQATAAEALGRGDLYVLDAGGEVVASMILNESEPPEYEGVSWRFGTSKSRVLVVHTLCVSPRYAGMGHAKSLIDYAVSEAESRGASSLRLDTYAGNKPARSLYEKVGFRLAGIAPMKVAGVLDEEQAFYELDLGRQDKEKRS